MNDALGTNALRITSETVVRDFLVVVFLAKVAQGIRVLVVEKRSRKGARGVVLVFLWSSLFKGGILLFVKNEGNNQGKWLLSLNGTDCWPEND